MPSPGDPDGGADFGLGKDQFEQLQDQMGVKYTTEAAALEFLGQMQFPAELIPTFYTPRRFWRDVLDQINRSGDRAALYRRLRKATERRRNADRTIAEIINEADPRVAEESEVAEPRPDGCHAIVYTPTARERGTVSRWLAAEGLAPQQVWCNAEMSSFAVSEADDTLLRARIVRRRPRLLYKVVPPGEEDYLIPRVTVIGAGRHEFHMRGVPAQLTLGDLAESAAQLHPSADSDLVDADRTIIYRGSPVDPASTLLQNGFRDGAKVTIESLRFGIIRVLVIGASPQGMHRVPFADEMRAIREKAAPGRVQLVGAVSNAKRSDLSVSAIADYRPDIIHLCCHGQGLNLILEDEESDPFPVDAPWFAQILTEWQDFHAHELSGIVLNSCSGEHIAPVLSEAARTVIAHKGSLASPRAELFTGNFYQELSRLPIVYAAALIAAGPIYPEGEGLLIFPPPPSGSR